MYKPTAHTCMAPWPSTMMHLLVLLQVLQVVHLETGSVLACDVGDKDIRPGEEACAATASPTVTAPCARNSFVLLRYVPPPNSPLEPDYGDDTLRYGQKVGWV